MVGKSEGSLDPVTHRRAGLTGEATDPDRLQLGRREQPNVATKCKPLGGKDMRLNKVYLHLNEKG